MAQKTAIEDNPAPHVGFWITQVMTGDRRNSRVQAQEFRQAFCVQYRAGARAVNRCESAAKLPPQNRLDRRAPILEYVVVDEDKPACGHIESVVNPHELKVK